MQKKYFVFNPGRQRSGYETMRVLSWGAPLFFDFSILRIKENGEITPHRDEMRLKWKHKKHYRFNVILPAREGGEFSAESVIFKLNLGLVKICLFRPDISTHQVSKVIKGTRYTLSFGIAL